MSDITFEYDGRDLPLRLTMRRVKLIKELTGFDVLAGGQFPGVTAMSAMLFALAGGEGKVGASLDDFEDTLTPSVVINAADLVRLVFERDARAGGDTGNVAPNASPSTG